MHLDLDEKLDSVLLLTHTHRHTHAHLIKTLYNLISQSFIPSNVYYRKSETLLL